MIMLLLPTAWATNFVVPKDVDKTEVRDNFTTYHMKDLAVTVYTGPFC